MGLFSEEDIMNKQISSGKTDHSNFMVICTSVAFKTLNGCVAAGFPVFSFPALLDHVISFLVVRSHSIYHIGAIHTK